MAKRSDPKLPSKSSVAQHWQQWQETHDGLVPWSDTPTVDLGEAHCMACHRYSESWNGDWQKANLDRCHLVPHTKGGSTDPSNFVLLCRRCHEDSPDTVDSQFMFDWMKEQPKYVLGRFSERSWAATQDMIANCLERYPSLGNQPELMAEAMRAAFDQLQPGLHFGVSGLSEGTHWAIHKKAMSIVPELVRKGVN